MGMVKLAFYLIIAVLGGIGVAGLIVLFTLLANRKRV